MINFGTVNDRDGMFYNIFKTTLQVRVCGYDDDEIYAIKFEESPDGEYWAWQDTGESEFHLIYPHEILFIICFPYGVQAEVDAGRGRVVRLKVKKAVKMSA